MFNGGKTRPNIKGKTMMDDDWPILDNWSILDCEEQPRQNMRLVGLKRQPDGKGIFISAGCIRKLDLKYGFAITTTDTYELGEPDPMWYQMIAEDGFGLKDFEV